MLLMDLTALAKAARRLASVDCVAEAGGTAAVAAIGVDEAAGTTAAGWVAGWAGAVAGGGTEAVLALTLFQRRRTVSYSCSLPLITRRLFSWGSGLRHRPWPGGELPDLVSVLALPVLEPDLAARACRANWALLFFTRSRSSGFLQSRKW